ncbi:MAG TPA: hypothetical protein VKN14_13970 [Flavobacteriaceae bacterium]|nr:hypothetical protein [Flavobacteriaceae bacterium]
MAQDIRDLVKQSKQLEKMDMPKGHETRFLKKLDKELPLSKTKSKFTFLNVAATIVLLFGLTFGGYKLFKPSVTEVIPEDKPVVVETKTLKDVSPQMKKVEDYYLASINYELSKMKVTPESKELFDGYLSKLEELNNEYNRLSKELIESGPNELTVNALIDNLKFRLNLLYRLRDKLNEFNNSESTYEESQL